MKRLHYLLIPMIISACSDRPDGLIEEPGAEASIAQQVCISVQGFSSESESRTSIDTNGSFHWTQGDTLGVFPSNGLQTAFVISEGSGSATAIFDGADWALRSSAQYAAYYPFKGDFYLTKEQIEVSYLGQKQEGNNNTSHIGRYDYLASAFTNVDESGNVNLSLSHLGALVRFAVTVPEAGTYTTFTLLSTGTPFTTHAAYGLTDAVAMLSPTQSAPTLTLSLKNLTTTYANEVVYLYMMMEPGDYGSDSWVATIANEQKAFDYQLSGKKLLQGCAYGFSAQRLVYNKLCKGQEFNAKVKQLIDPSAYYYTDDNTIQHIVFEPNSANTSGTVVSEDASDIPVYAYFDSETATVHVTTSLSSFICGDDISYMFYHFKKTETIDFQHVVDTRNVTDMKFLFSNCVSLSTLDISGFNTENVTSMRRVFEYCGALSELKLEGINTQKVTDMDGMFAFCSALESLDLSSFNTRNVTKMILMFYYCNHLQSLSLGLNFVITNSTNKGKMMCDHLASEVASCTISCLQATRTSLETDTSLDTQKIVWVIL